MPTDPTVKQDKRYVEPDTPLHIVGQEWHLAWYPEEVEKVIKLWGEGKCMLTIADELNSQPTSIFLLLLDLAEHNRIKRRAGYLWGVG